MSSDLLSEFVATRKERSLPAMPELAARGYGSANDQAADDESRD